MKLIPSLVALSCISMACPLLADTPAETGSGEPALESGALEATADTTATEGTSDTTTTDSSTTETETATAPAEGTEQAGFFRGSVARSIFTTAIQEREPIDKLNNTSTNAEQLFYFTELRDMSGQTATHRWEYDGKVMAEVKFDVRGPRWRVWSSKSFVPGWAGDWKVSVINGAGETISEEMINLSAIPATESAAEPVTTDNMAAEPASEAPAGEPAVEEFQPPVNDQLLQ